MPVRTAPPNHAARVIPAALRDQILQDWDNYVRGVDPLPPLLGRPGGAQVYITDPESIFNCTQAVDFETRLSLVAGTTANGCVIIFLSTEGLGVAVPPAGPGAATNGLTADGAREWVITENPGIDLSLGSMEMFEVDASSNRSGPIP